MKKTVYLMYPQVGECEVFKKNRDILTNLGVDFELKEFGRTFVTAALAYKPLIWVVSEDYSICHHLDGNFNKIEYVHGYLTGTKREKE